MLAIEVSFLTGRYVATAYNTRTEGEWPPHPARLFSALAATHFATGAELRNANGERAILEWLEGLGPPAIVASDAALREVVTVFVPVNDVALTNVDDDAARVDEAMAAVATARTAGDAKTLKKAESQLRKSDVTLKKAIARATEVPARPMDPRHGERLLPEHRGRQPRTFPSMTPEDPRVTYVWPDAPATDILKEQLDHLLARVVRLGHSSTLVSMRLVAEPAAAAWHPAEQSDLSLRVVEPGQLRALEDAFARHQEIEPRVMPARPQPYIHTRDLAPGAEPTPDSVFSSDWLVLRRVEGPSLPITATVGMARTLRKALMSFAREPIPEMLSGHTADRRPSQQPHLAFVPLPFVGHERASGTIVGVALVLPRSARHDERRAVYEAVAAWEQKHRQDAEDTPTVKLNLGSAGELWLERIEWGAPLVALRAETWSAVARVWHSVTPVALDRNPGDLRSRDPKRLEEATASAAETIADACTRIDLPRPAFVEILPAAPLAGAAKARLYPPFPEDPGRTQRVLTHARLEFDLPVRGPILLGAGRYLGLGLFRPKTS